MGHGRRIAVCGHTPTKPGFPKGYPLWHTTLLARYSVLYLPVRLTGKRRVSPDGNARFARQGNGQGFVPGRGQNPCLFPESGGRYTSPRPSSFVPRRAEISAPDDAPLRKNQRGRASTFGLARLDYPKARPGGGGQWRRTCAPFISTIDGPAWVAIACTPKQ
mgnify:FL=1